MSSPIFIVGANRSGTTLMRLILNAHPRIGIPDELIYLDAHLAGVPVETWEAPPLSEAAFEAFVDEVLQARAPLVTELDEERIRQCILRAGPNLRAPYRCLLEAWAAHHGKARWGEKTPGNLFYVDVLHDMFPGARFLYLVRDPRAGVASMQGVDFFPDDVVMNALGRRTFDVQGRAHLRSHVPTAQRMTVRYEDLVRRPEAMVRSVCRFVDEEFCPGMLQFHRDADQYMTGGAPTGYNETATHPITDDRVDAWRETLDPDEVAAVESVCASVMETFRYAATDRTPTLRRQAEIVGKHAYWRLQRWRHRSIRHYTVKHRAFARLRGWAKDWLAQGAA